ncbi:MAG: hypothetical protein AB7I19_16410 [Planctomycetota bacterium]
MSRILSLLVASTLAATLALMIVRWMSADPASQNPHPTDTGIETAARAGAVEPGAVTRSVAAVATNTAQALVTTSEESTPSESTPESTGTQPSYLFDLDALRKLFESGLVGVENQEGRILSAADIDEIMSDMKLGFDQAQLLHESMRELKPSGSEYDNCRTLAGTWELVAAVLPECLNHLRGAQIGAQLELHSSLSPGVQNFVDLPHGDLRMTIKGQRWMLSITVPHTIGPRALWRECYEIHRRQGALPARMFPSSIPGVGTLDLDQLLGEAK